MQDGDVHRDDDAGEHRHRNIPVLWYNFAAPGAPARVAKEILT